MENYIKTDNSDNILELQLNVLVFQEGEYFVAYCPAMQMSSYGDSIDEAKQGFDEVMGAYIENCKENNTLREDLLKIRWTINVQNHAKAEPPTDIDLNIPAGLLRNQFNENWNIPVS